MGWIDRAVVTDKRRVVVERLMYLRIPFLARSETLVSHVIRSLELLNYLLCSYFVSETGTETCLYEATVG